MLSPSSNLPTKRKRGTEPSADDEDKLIEDTEEVATESDSSEIACTYVIDDTDEAKVKAPNTDVSKLKCLKCSRVARKNCTGLLCIRCCTDVNCVVHEEQRAKARWKERVMAGTTEIQILADKKRKQKIPMGRFHETEFKYLNDTVILWDLNTFMNPTLPTKTVVSDVAKYKQNIKIRDEILRKSSKNIYEKGVRSNRKRIRGIIDDLYQKSLKES